MKQYKRHIAHNEEPNQYLIGREEFIFIIYNQYSLSEYWFFFIYGLLVVYSL